MRSAYGVAAAVTGPSSVQKVTFPCKSTVPCVSKDRELQVNRVSKNRELQVNRVSKKRERAIFIQSLFS